jgi:hypothetical protein
VLAALALASAGLVALAAWIAWSRRAGPVERERRRRQRLNTMGRLFDGLLTDREGDLVHYAYQIHGVSYTASQDISALRDRVPDDASRIVGPVTLKYWVRNPANSIVICEDWSGLRVRLDPRGDNQQ